MGKVKQIASTVLVSNVNKDFALIRKKLVYSALSVILLIIACANLGASPDTEATSSPTKVRPTDTVSPTSTSTPKPTPTPNLTATQRAVIFTATANSAETLASQANQWNMKLSDTFENNSNQWYASTFNDEWGKGEIKVADGKYRWTYTAHQDSVRRVWRYTTSLTDFFLTVDIREIGDSQSSEYGIVFRNSTGNDFYYFGIYPKQRQFFFYLFYKDEWTTLIDSTSSSIIHTDGTNVLTLIAQGSHFAFFINNRFVSDTTDDTLSYGPMGLIIGLGANDQSVFEFDNLVLRTLPN